MTAATCSALLIQPFIKLCAEAPDRFGFVPEAFRTAPPDGRVPLDAVHDVLERAVGHTHDAALGLKLGAAMCFGAGGLFDYVVRTAATVGDSFAVASRCCRLLSDSFRLAFDRSGDRAVVRLDNTTPWPKVAAEFGMASLYGIHVADLARRAPLECWFPYAAPRDLAAHERVFRGAALRFDAACYGFAFPREHANAAMPGADPALHTILLGRVDAVLLELSRSRSLAELVRHETERRLASGSAVAPEVASTFKMSRRTLARRLQREGTSFNREVDATRRELALSQVKDPTVSLTEVAFSVGFSHVESFHRAFKRWTGQTPLSYRRSQNPRGC